VLLLILSFIFQFSAIGQVQVYDSNMNLKSYYVLDGDYTTAMDWLYGQDLSDKMVQKKIYKAIYHDETGNSEKNSRGSATVKFWEMVRGTQHWVECEIVFPPIYYPDGRLAQREWTDVSSGIYKETIVSGGITYNVYTNDILGPSDYIFVPQSR